MEHPRTDSERGGDGDAGGDGVKDPLNLLREAFDIYDSKKAPWEQSKAYFEKLKEFCDYSEKWRKEQEKTITRPHNRDAGETRKGNGMYFTNYQRNDLRKTEFICENYSGRFGGAAVAG